MYAELAADALYDSDFAAMEGWAARARGIAAAGGDAGLGAAAAGLECFAHYGLGATAAARAAQADGAALLDALDDGALAGRLEAPYYLGFAEYFCERYDDAIRHLRRGIAVSRAVGQGQFVVPMMVGLSSALWIRGRMAEAVELAEDAGEAARLAGNDQLAGWALVAEAIAAASLGDLERALAAAEEAVALVRGLDDSVLTRATQAHVTLGVARRRAPRALPGGGAGAGRARAAVDRAGPPRVALQRAGPRRARPRQPPRRRGVGAARRGHGRRARPAGRRRQRPATRARSWRSRTATRGTRRAGPPRPPRRPRRSAPSSTPPARGRSRAARWPRRATPRPRPSA